jgi:hypothetical protein
LSAAFFARGRAFFSGLEKEFDGALNLRAHSGQNLGNAERDGGVSIVSASVFDSGNQGFVGDIDGFVDRESVHIRAESDDGTGPRAFEESDDAVFGDVGFDIVDAESAQPIRDDARSAFFVIGKLGMHVEVAADLNESGAECVGSVGDLRRVIGNW